MSNAIVFAVITGIGVYGLIMLLIKRRHYRFKYEFGIEFLNNLQKYWESSGKDWDTYSWLIHRSNKMQGEMGGHGVTHGYKPPYQNFIIKRYEIILNMIPELRKCLENDLLRTNPLASQYFNALQESLVRYIGSIEDMETDLKKELKNPIKWFRHGVRDIVALPAYLLGWLGVISDLTVKRIVSSLLFSAISGIFALVGFVSAILTIVIGWDKFLEIVTKIWP
ncbi:hypothetical protein [Desulfobacter postgatei]|uniref:Uncharacterized protein n=1 Tax=Desulfobacter postgatei 2ac9 TaxID=879212 RepID=I5B7L0_9BACT|nr:hypothetical protein [Desulfobacter postgatei]EIM65473.1 hypothetical protein DespoDRAFT_03738 [Desulfobacter postgatei 2ac9]